MDCYHTQVQESWLIVGLPLHQVHPGTGELIDGFLLLPDTGEMIDWWVAITPRYRWVDWLMGCYYSQIQVRWFIDGLLLLLPDTGEIIDWWIATTASIPRYRRVDWLMNFYHTKYTQVQERWLIDELLPHQVHTGTGEMIDWWITTTPSTHRYRRDDWLIATIPSTHRYRRDDWMVQERCLIDGWFGGLGPFHWLLYLSLTIISARLPFLKEHFLVFI